MSTPASSPRLRRAPIYVAAVCLSFFMAFTWFLFWRESVSRIREDEARAVVDRFLSAMSRGDYRTAEAETLGLRSGDVQKAGEVARIVWGRGWTATRVQVPVLPHEWASVEGDLAGLDGKVRAFSARLGPDPEWRIGTFVIEGGALLPYPLAAESPDEIPILGLRAVKREGTDSVWVVEVEIDLVAPALGSEGRWTRRGVMLRARILDPRGTVHEWGGVSSTWDEDPALPGRKVLVETIRIDKSWGSGKYRITLVAERGSRSNSSRDVEIELP